MTAAERTFNRMKVPEIVDTFTLLLVISGIGAVSQVAKILTGPRNWTFLEFIGGVLGAAIAAFSVGAIMLDRGASPLLSFGIAGPIGWVGGTVLSKLALMAENRLGISNESPERPKRERGISGNEENEW